MLLSLTVFMLLVAEIMPATSDSVPLIGETAGPVTLPPLHHAVKVERDSVSQSAGVPPFGGGVSSMISTNSFCVPAQYFATTMVIVGLSVIATVLVLQYHHHDPDGGHMPRWVSTSSLCFPFTTQVKHSE